VCAEWHEADDGALALRIEWHDKPANRMPEALWLHFAPQLTGDAFWEVEKLGSWIDMRTIRKNGSAQLHATSRGVRCGDLSIDSLDAALVAPGCGSLLNFVTRIPRPAAGIAFNLYNNIWGTNFPMWNSGHAVFRFAIRFAGG
jgi:hypothetical protein